MVGQTTFKRPSGSGSRERLVFLKLLLESRAIHLLAAFDQNLLGQLQWKAVGRKQYERLLASNAAGRTHLLKLLQSLLDRPRKFLLLLFNLIKDSSAIRLKLAVE